MTILKRYVVNYKGKKYISKGESATEAFEKFANKPIFGCRQLIENHKLIQCDADTYGYMWSRHQIGWDEEDRDFVDTELAKEEN